MKNVSKETLQAIQSNVKVEETQSLERSVDNLLQASWKDFEIANLQPNLVPNGWDSFEPYGNVGKETKAPLEVFEENYSQNILNDGMFLGDDAWSVVPEQSDTTILKGKVSIRSNGGIGVLQQATNSSINEVDLYYIRIDITNHQSGRLVFPTYYYNIIERDTFDKNGFQSALYTYNRTTLSVSISHSNGSSLDIGEIYTVNLTKVFGKGNEPTKEWCDNNLKYYANWNDVPEKDKPVRAWDNMAVHMTSLGNGLTRIQTWGGNSETKLRYENTGLKSLSLIGNGKGIIKNNDKIVAIKDFTSISGEGNFDLVGDLDFIASDPQIVEGDKHNPVLVVDQLEDGREHVQVYGAYPDTKLVYKGGKGFIGENYKLTSNIKNEGVELGINTSIGSSTIPKGDSKLEIEGELQEQDFTIELGARDV